MKIAFIVNAFPILSETFILNQITGLIDRGHEVDIYAVHFQDQPVVHADVERYDLLDRTFYRGTVSQRMPANRFLRLAKTIGLIITSFHKNPLPLLRSLNVFKFGREAASLSLFYQVLPFLDKDLTRYDIVHCHFGPNGNLAARLKGIGVIKGKVITTFHSGFDLAMYLMRKGDHAYDHLFEMGDLFLPISERWKEQLIRLGCDEQKIVVHRMGVDTSKLVLSPQQPGDDGKLCVLTIARLVEKKGVQYGIQAVAKALKKYPHIEYRIAGDGPLREELESLVEALGVANNVILLGWKRQEEIIELIQDVDLLLAPSVTSVDGDQEGIPVVLMEALARGLPVLSTQHSGIPELVQDGVSGFLVPERDVDALTEKLEHLVEHPEMWSEMGQAGRDYVERHYDIHALNDKLVQLYQRVLNVKLPSRRD
ncbi:MAG: glycosyltransferase [Chloroflexota bacterium]|nr:glycosyltransferase [Chloroflexota bacterium]